MSFVPHILIEGPDLPQVGNELPQFNLEQFHSLLIRVIRTQYIAH